LKPALAKKSPSKNPLVKGGFQKGAKRWSFRNWHQMVIQALVKNLILALVFAMAIKGIKNGKVRIIM
jgi:hypothetical protein